MSSITAWGRTACRGVLLVVLITIPSLGFAWRAVAQEAEPRSRLNPLLDQHGQSPPEMNHVPSDVRDTAGMFGADAVRGRAKTLRSSSGRSACPC